MEPGNQQLPWTQSQPPHQPPHQPPDQPGTYPPGGYGAIPGRDPNWGAPGSGSGAYGPPDGDGGPPSGWGSAPPTGAASVTRPPVTRSVSRARVGLAVLAAVLVEIAAIAAVGNQSVSKRIIRHLAENGSDSFGQNSLSALLNFSWRFTPLKHDQHLWESQLAAIGTILVATALLVLVLLRGDVTFGRAFFGTWLAVTVAVALAGAVQGLIFTVTKPPGVSRLTYAVFNGPGPDNFVAGVALGLVVALITALVAVTTRRTVGSFTEPGTGPAADEREPFFEPPPPRHAAGSEPVDNGTAETTQLPSLEKDHRQAAVAEPIPPPPSDTPPNDTSDETSRLPRFGDGEQQTTQLPPWSEGTANPGTAAESPTGNASQRPAESAPGSAPDQPSSWPPRQQSGEAPTTQFPRPPDDEDLDQRP